MLILLNILLMKRIIKDKKLSNIRKTIARLQTKSTIPHFYLKGKVQLDTLLEELN